MKIYVLGASGSNVIKLTDDSNTTSLEVQLQALSQFVKVSGQNDIMSNVKPHKNPTPYI